MTRQITLPPPPEGIPISQEERTSNEWQTWFNLLQNILDSQGLSHYPPVSPGGGDQPKYWHKLYDPAWMHMSFEDLGTGKVVAPGQSITNYDTNVIEPYQISTDLAQGTVAIDSDDYVQEGMYHVSIHIFGDLGVNSNSRINVYRDGVDTGIGVLMVTKSLTTTFGVYSGLLPISNGGYYLRNNGGDTISIYTIGWSMHRVSPLPEWEG